jgi:isopentenyl-diphosphate delta-isomerase
MKEHVVLVDEANNKLGLEDKYKVHTGYTPLHRGFSVFIFNSSGDLLLQQRSEKKITWPNVWSNSVCGHPADNESAQQAAKRRAKFELGIDIDLNDIEMILPEYRYRYEHYGVVENEICPVMVAFGEFSLSPNPDEVGNTRWIKWVDFLDEVSKPNKYSEWCQEEALLIEKSPKFQRLFKVNQSK